MDSLTFNRLIHSFKKDVASFTVIYTYYFPRIKIYINRKYSDYHFGEDIAHEFFMKLFRIEIPKWINNPTVWIFKACDNLAKTQIIALKMNIMVPLCEDSAIAADIDDDYNSLENGGISKDNIEMLKNFDDMTVEILVMHFWEGYNYKEIAEKLGISHNRVRQKASRALRKLEDYL